jgi:pyruvate kinase
LQIARFDFSYGDQQLHQASIDNLRKASKATRQLCATMMDTLGPEIVVTNRCAFAGTLNSAGQQPQPHFSSKIDRVRRTGQRHGAAASVSAMYRFHQLNLRTL